MITGSLKGGYVYLCLVAAFIGLCLVVFTLLSCNDENSGTGNGDTSSLTTELLAKDEPDECFCGIGARDNGPIGDSVTGDCSDLTPEEPLTECEPKRDYSYVWSLTKIGRKVWFGTLPNASCVISSTQFSRSKDFIPPELAHLVACEFGDSRVASSKPVPILGDHRTPQIKVYDTGTRTLQDISVDNCEGGSELLDTTLGPRQGGSMKIGDLGVVVLCGPSLLGGVNMFAFDAETGACLGVRNFAQYNDCRKTIVVNGILYSAVGKSADEDNPDGGGRVLRYVGDLSDPLKWEEVGKLDTIGANLAFHEGRIYVGTWPNINPILTGPGPIQIPNFLTGPRPGIFMSPVVPPEGLTNANFNDWVKVWVTSDYEPDPVAAAAYGLGDLASFQGRLWWGTINVPTAGFLVHSFLFDPDLLNDACPSDPDCLARLNEARRNTTRITALFRGRNFDSTPEIELLYGESSLPVFNSSTGVWEEMPNSMSATPLLGKSGIDNSQNIYTWSMAVFRDHLYVGTADASLVAGIKEPDNAFGADLFRFSDLSSGAEPVSLDGFGNFLNYGIRNMLPDEDGKNGDDALYIGTANPFNLAPEGGWELLRLR